MKEFEWFEWFEWFGPSPIEPFNSGFRAALAPGADGAIRAVRYADPVTREDVWSFVWSLAAAAREPASGADSPRSAELVVIAGTWLADAEARS